MIPSELLPAFLLAELADQPSHGYALAERVGMPAPHAGSLYRALRVLEAEGHVTSTWHPPAGRGPARKVYRITRGGRAALRRARRDTVPLIHRLSAFVDANP